METKILYDSRNNPIHLYHYVSKQPTIHGVVHLIHGASEHFARYGMYADFMNKSGYHVIGIDFLAHGLSSSNLSTVHFADTLGNQIAYEGITLTQEAIKEWYPTLPVFLVGHSMGSFLARKAIIEKPTFYEKVILSGTAFVPRLLSGFGLFLCDVIQLFKGPKYVSKLLQDMSIDANPKKMRRKKIIQKRNVEWLTKDETVQNYYFQSPMCGQPFTVRANHDLFTWLKEIHQPSALKIGNK